jgi:hypothetical protein
MEESWYEIWILEGMEPAGRTQTDVAPDRQS